MENYATVLTMLMRLRQICDHPSLCPKMFIEGIRKLEKETVLSDLNNDLLISKLAQILHDAIESGEDCCICMDALREARITYCAHFFCKVSNS
jgi:SWI/SNF-related matrix-associated actin-dependent regulator of chromatin subfamily A3